MCHGKIIGTLFLLLFNEFQFAWNPFKSPEIINELEQKLKKSVEKDRAQILNQISYEYFNKTFNPELILKYAKLAYENAKINNQSHEMIIALSNIGHGYRRIMKIDTALDYINQAIKLAKENKDNNGEIYALDVLSDLYLRNNRLNESLKIKKMLLDRSLKENNKTNMAKYYFQVALCFCNNSKTVDLFKEYLNKALILYTELNDFEYQVKVLLEMGILEISSIKNFNEAFNIFQKALEICKRKNIGHMIPLIVYNFGDLYYSIGDYKKALEYYKESFSCFDKVEPDYEIYHLFLNFGITYENLGDYANSLKYFLKAQQLENKIFSLSKKRIVVTLISIAGVYLNLKDYLNALDICKKALNISTENQLIDLFPMLHNMIGFIYKAEKNYEDAEKHYLLGLKTANELKSKDDILNSLTELTDFYETTKKYELAFNHLKKSNGVRDEINKNKQEELLKDRLTKYETEKKDSVIIFLKQNEQIRKLQLDRSKLIRNGLIIGLGLILVIFLLLFKRYLYLLAFWKKKSYIGQYRIMERIGSGGFGTVYKAHNIRDKTQVVAVKVLNADVLDAANVKRFVNESEFIEKLDHPNIIKVFERGEDSKSREKYIAMELLDGAPLSVILKEKGRFALRDCLHIMVQISEALEQIHRKAIIHRDLKPENIMLIEKGGDPYFVKLLDFGIAITNYETRLTKTGYFMGSLNYVSPEQLIADKNIAMNTKSDIFSLGIVFLEILNGGLPEFGNTTEAIPQNILNNGNKVEILIDTLPADIPAPVKSLLREMLQKSSDLRPSAEEVLQAIRPLQGNAV